MRLAPSSTRFLLALVLVGASLGSAESQGAESRRPGPMEQRIRELQALVNPDAAEETRVAPPASRRFRPQTNRPTTGLNGASLQPNTSLDSTARGLTPGDEWRQMFPRKEQ